MKEPLYDQHLPADFSTRIIYCYLYLNMKVLLGCKLFRRVKNSKTDVSAIDPFLSFERLCTKVLAERSRFDQYPAVQTHS